MSRGAATDASRRGAIAKDRRHPRRRTPRGARPRTRSRAARRTPASSSAARNGRRTTGRTRSRRRFQSASSPAWRSWRPGSTTPGACRGCPVSPDTAVVALDDDGRPVGAAWWHVRDRSLLAGRGPRRRAGARDRRRGGARRTRPGCRSSPARRPRGPRRRARPRPVGPQRPHPQPRRPPLQPRGVRGRGEGPRTARRRDGPGSCGRKAPCRCPRCWC